MLIVSPSLKAGGIERALSVLANQFVNMGIKVYYISCLPGDQHYKIDERVLLIKSGIPYRGKLGKLFFYPKLILFLRQKITSINPQAVLSFGDVFNPLVLLALLGTRNSIFISDRTSPTFKINPLANVLKTVLYPYSKGFIAQTETMLKHMNTRFSNNLNIRVIPNAINQIEKSESIEQKTSVLYVGRLSWEKGVDRLINAFSKVKNKEGWTLDLVGDGPAYKELNELTISLGIEKEVVFHGLNKNPTKFYNEASIFVLPSHIEGFPNALCEAMSAELPVVCFDSIPFQDLFINGESGIAVEKDNIDAMAMSLQDLIASPHQRKKMGKMANKEVSRLTPERISKEYLQFMNII